MDHNSYPMKKLGYNTKDYKTMKPNDCGSNVKYCLLFTSLIQMLIILGLILFMIYGNTYSSHQSHLETSQNQSVQLIKEVQNLKGAERSLKKNLTSCNYKNGNLTEQMKNTVKTMRRCILYKNCTDYLPLNPYFPECNSLKRNNTDNQMKLAKCTSDLQLMEMRQKLKEIEVQDQIRKLYQQLRDFGGNCTSMSKDFRTTLNEIKANYESFFSKLASGMLAYRWDMRDQLNQIKANCSPLSLSFEAKVQQQLSRAEREIEMMQRAKVDQQRTIDNLKRANEECKKGAAVKLDDNTKELEKLVESNKQCLERMIEVLGEKEGLQNYLNNLRNRHQPYNYLFNKRAIPSFESSCQENVDLLKKKVDLLNIQLAAMQRKEAFMDLKLKEQEARCSNCRVPEHTG
ncbi:plasmalemma vesicle associated protein a [Hypanus sabinus]|uniref:plasmalemma vesicle associated protein a n=1 Tax=Hypanus sabinus TaxID=79690 RepID=UPI0028C3AF0A|nr:plasmalemma vesicle associated protein a [Hypanus sabinus]